LYDGVRATNLFAWQHARQSFGLELLTGRGCLERSTFRVLVVDDHEPWRSFALRALQRDDGMRKASPWMLEKGIQTECVTKLVAMSF